MQAANHAFKFVETYDHDPVLSVHKFSILTQKNAALLHIYYKTHISTFSHRLHQEYDKDEKYVQLGL